MGICYILYQNKKIIIVIVMFVLIVRELMKNSGISSVDRSKVRVQQTNLNSLLERLGQSQDDQDAIKLKQTINSMLTTTTGIPENNNHGVEEIDEDDEDIDLSIEKTDKETQQNEDLRIDKGLENFEDDNDEALEELVRNETQVIEKEEQEVIQKDKEPDFFEDNDQNNVEIIEKESQNIIQKDKEPDFFEDTDDEDDVETVQKEAQENKDFQIEKESDFFEDDDDENDVEVVNQPNLVHDIKNNNIEYIGPKSNEGNVHSGNDYATVDDLPYLHPPVNCKAIVEGDENEIEKAKSLQTHMTFDPVQESKDLHKLSQNCDNFRNKRKYLMKPVNEEEENFPIAFSLLMYKDIFQTERLLRAIYRPQNLYCIHVDNKSSELIHETMRNIAGCFDNVFIASTLIDVRWGWFSVVKPELICLKDLLAHPKPWRYFVNTCGQEFPIKSNYEIVRILRAFNGSNDVQGRRSDIIPQVLKRIKYGFTEESTRAKKYEKPNFPYNITWAKGSLHVALTRGFSDFMINNKIAQEFVEYISDTPHSSEHLWTPIHFSPHLGAPGSYTGYPNIRHDPVRGISVVRYKIWHDTHRTFEQYRCHGKFARQICVIALGDLYPVVHSGRLIVNKFHADYHPLAYDCLEEHVFNSTRLDIQGVDRLNISFYQQLDFVKNHI